MNNKRTDILLVNYAFSIFRGGGENFAYNIHKELSKKNYNCSVLTVRPLFSKFDPLDNSDVEVKYVRAFWFYRFATYLKSINKNFSKVGYLLRIIGQASFEIAAFLYIIRQKRKYKLVLSCGLPLITFLLSKIDKTNSIMRAPGPFQSPYEKIFYPFINIVANGDAFRNLKKLYPSNTFYLEIGVDQTLRVNINKELQNRPLNIAIVSRLIPIKRVIELINILKIVNDLDPIKIHIFGDGILREQLIKRAFELKLDKNIKMYGFLNKNDLFNLMAALDCLLMNSFYDNFPNVLIEANALGLPVWATNVGGIDLIIQNNKNGIIVDKDLTDDQKARSIYGFLNLIKKGSFNSFEISKNCKRKFNWSKTASNLIKIAENNK